jgi:hypothetical protein
MAPALVVDSTFPVLSVVLSVPPTMLRIRPSRMTSCSKRKTLTPRKPPEWTFVWSTLQELPVSSPCNAMPYWPALSSADSDLDSDLQS